MNITNAARKKALMSHYAGEEVDDIIDTLVVPAPAGDANEYTVFRDALNTHFLPQMNTEYAIYEFRARAQEQGETLDMYVTELKKLAKFCNFQNLDLELKSQIIQNCLSTKLRTQSLENCDWTLKQVLDKGRAMELSERQAGIIEQGETSVNRVQTKYTGKLKQQPWKGKEKPKGQSQPCGRCGNPHGGDIKNCPTYGQMCSNVRELTTTRNTARPLLCRLNQEKHNNFVRSLLLGPHLQIHTCWLAPCCLESSRRILAPLYLPCVAAAVHTVCCVPATSPFLRQHVYFVCLI